MRLAKGCRKVGPQHTTLNRIGAHQHTYILTKEEQARRRERAQAAAHKHNEILAIF